MIVPNKKLMEKAIPKPTPAFIDDTEIINAEIPRTEN
jgi:hypothetical protein